MTEPLITTIIPTFQRPQLLERAIRSVLAQQVPDHVVAVYDNASADGTGELVARLAAADRRVLYHRHPRNLGAFENFQFGLREVRTPFFAFLGDDDLFLPPLFTAALAGFERAPAARLVATQVRHVEADGTALVRSGQWEPRLYEPPEGLYAMLRFGHPMWTGTVFRREVIEEVGLLNPQAAMAADLEYQLRIAARFPFLVDATEGAVYHHHPASISGARRLETIWPNWLSILDAIVDDERVPSGVREQAGAMIAERMRHHLYHLGVGAALQGAPEDAGGAARVLSDFFGRPAEAALIRGLSALNRLMPASGSAFRWAVARTRLFRHRGWRRRSTPAP